MISRTTPHRSRIAWQKLFFASLVIVGGCATPRPPPLPQVTQLQVRELQTRVYESSDIKTVMKAVIAAFQDEGYIISAANTELGLVSAALEKFEEDRSTKAANEFWYGVGQGTYQTTKRFEANATVNAHDNKIRVRINIVAKAITNTGGIIWSQPVYDSAIYQNIFTKIHKSVFLEEEKI